MNSALIKILSQKNKSFLNNSSTNNAISEGTNFTVRKISLKRTVEILAKNNIEVNNNEAAIILNFLYHIAQNYDKYEAYKRTDTLMGNRI